MPLAPNEALRRYLERYSRGPEQEIATIGGRPLPKRKRRTLAWMGLALIVVECWVWMLIVPWFGRSIWQEHDYRLLSPAAFGFLISILAVAVIMDAAVQLFTEVDSRGIHRPDWAGGDFIPWTSVTEVSIARSPAVLQVRAGEKKALLSLMLFCNPATVVSLIRRSVPADRLKGF